MVQEIDSIFQNLPYDASLSGIKEAILTENILNKKSISGRNKTLTFLKRMYGLDDSIPLYRIFRFFWKENEKERPMLALLYALARDESLRVSADYILSLSCGDRSDKEVLIQHLHENLEGSFTDKTMKSMAENLLSSWTQSGHLTGRLKKFRAKAVSGSASLTFTLCLGAMMGQAGMMLLRTPWIPILDMTTTERDDALHNASVQGLISYKAAGGMVEITLSDNLCSLGGL